jgi:IS66 C-terminal element/Transposase IS66 family
MQTPLARDLVYMVNHICEPISLNRFTSSDSGLLPQRVGREDRLRFIDDGRIELDTNIVERGMRPIALNRKNALFAGHDGGAENWACLASLIETCKLHGVDPQAYFADVLTKLVNLWPQSRLDELLPWVWAANRTTSQLAA